MLVIYLEGGCYIHQRVQVVKRLGNYICVRNAVMVWEIYKRPYMFEEYVSQDCRNLRNYSLRK